MTRAERRAMAEQRRAMLRDLKLMYRDWHTGYYRIEDPALSRKALRYARRMLAAAMCAVRKVKP
jgi:hypothetical protein